MAKTKPKRKLRILKKGQRCGKGWTSVELRMGRTTKRACIRGKVLTYPSTAERVMDALQLLAAPLTGWH